MNEMKTDREPQLVVFVFEKLFPKWRCRKSERTSFPGKGGCVCYDGNGNRLKINLPRLPNEFVDLSLDPDGQLLRLRGHSQNRKLDRIRFLQIGRKSAASAMRRPLTESKRRLVKCESRRRN
jgi:hypothetical protein